MKPEAIDLLLAAGALERAAITANPARRCPLERVASYLRELAGPLERKPVREWRELDFARVRELIADAASDGLGLGDPAPLTTPPAVPPAAAWVAPVRFEQREPWLRPTPALQHFCCGEQCRGLSFSVRERAHPPSCLGPTQTHQGLTREQLSGALTVHELDQICICEARGMRKPGTRHARACPAFTAFYCCPSCPGLQEQHEPDACYQVGRSKHGRCECGEDLEHFTGPNAGGVLCPSCDSEYIAELRELNEAPDEGYDDIGAALTIELER